MPRFFVGLIAVLSLSLLDVLVAKGADVFAVVPLTRLQIVEGELPANFNLLQFRYLGVSRQPRVAIEGPGEVFIGTQTRSADRPSGNIQDLAVRLATPREVAGKLYLPDYSDPKKTHVIRFKIATADFSAKREQFLNVRLSHYEQLQNLNLPGGAWFRHQYRETAKALGLNLKEGTDGRAPFERERDWEESFAIFSGGRAISENIQLDRSLPTSKPTEESVPLAKLVGITVKEFDWAPLIKDAKPEVDPLAKLIPADQHALFFPSFNALVQAIDLAKQHGTPVLQLSQSRTEDAQSHERYQRQMCLPLGEVEKLVGPLLIDSVAITGGDPYFRTGTDVAVLMAAKAPAALRQLLEARLKQECSQSPEVLKLDGEILGVKYSGARSSDRRICSYLAELGGVVVVSNSPVQLERVIRVHQSAEKPLAELPEYTFFRTRYAKSDDTELAFLVLSDSTIRRWCGPKWRIATSRLTRAAALLSEIQASNADAIVRGKVTPTDLPSEFWLSEGERQSLSSRGATSAMYGNLEFQTPISELSFDVVTAEESRFYERWRNTYQQNWSNFFDPIAIRFSNSKQKLSVDITVMPLIDNTEYRQFIEVSKGAKIADGGDPHPEALAHIVLALNPESALLKQYAAIGNALAPQIKVNPLSWIGNSIAVYADEDPFWLEVAKSDSQRDFLESNSFKLPIAVNIGVRNGLKLAAFLAGLRAFIEQSAPGMTVWETLEHREIPYVKLTASERGRSIQDQLGKLEIYYCASGESLVITLNEAVMKRAIDRQKLKSDSAKSKDAVAPLKTEWLGDSLCLTLNNQFHKVLAAVYRENYQRAMQEAAWSNIPILNEWKTRYPELDPSQVHQKLWSRKLGEDYRWNDTWQTMESTVYGHPAKPSTGPDLPPVLMDYVSDNFGLTFEENGLRARVELLREVPKRDGQVQP